MWFETWSEIWRILLIGPAAYVALVVVLRTSGKRTLAKLNAFDLVVTVALGSTLATIFLSADVSWAEGVVALAVLAVLQFVVAGVTSRFPGSRSVLTSGPSLVLVDGRMRTEVLRRQRLTEAEVRQAVRAAGVGDLAEVAAVVLESDGSLSVITADRRGDASALADLPDAAAARA